MLDYEFSSVKIERICAAGSDESWVDASLQLELVGNVARYDFQSAGAEIPKLDLPALEPFFRYAMQIKNRRITKSDDGLSVATPEHWRGSPDLRERYDGLVFDRSLPADKAMVRLLGVGHPLIDRALQECRDSEVLLACQSARKTDPRSASKIGSDAKLMQPCVSRLRQVGLQEGRVSRAHTSDA